MDNQEHKTNSIKRNQPMSSLLMNFTGILISMATVKSPRKSMMTTSSGTVTTQRINFLRSHVAKDASVKNSIPFTSPTDRRGFA